jgi:hypothetical protein
MTYYRSPWCGALYWSQCYANSYAATTLLNKTKVKLALFVQFFLEGGPPGPRGTPPSRKGRHPLACWKFHSLTFPAHSKLALFVHFLFFRWGCPPVGLVPPAGGVPTVGNLDIGLTVGGQPAGGLAPAVGTGPRGGPPSTVGREQNVGQTPWSAADPLVGLPTHLQIYPVGPSPTVGPLPTGRSGGRPQTRGSAPPSASPSGASGASDASPASSSPSAGLAKKP